MNAVEWERVAEELDAQGSALLERLLSQDECRAIAGLYGNDEIFRSRVVMARHGFGRGEYKYFNYPLPPTIQSLRELFYPPLAKVANDWMQRLGTELEFPSSHGELIKRCWQNQQNRPTPLILRYESGGFNTLHQDLYGEIYFPFQVVFVLSRKGRDHEGGEFVLTEQVPRAQSKVRVLHPGQGDAVIFTTNFRPIPGAKGYYKAKMKHGVSEITTGTRYSLGIIFHDAA